MHNVALMISIWNVKPGLTLCVHSFGADKYGDGLVMFLLKVVGSRLR